jgi:hypothetical protein
MDLFYVTLGYQINFSTLRQILPGSTKSILLPKHLYYQFKYSSPFILGNPQPTAQMARPDMQP